MEQVLMVVTSHGRIEPDWPTGLWLEEFTVPYNEFRAEGLEITVASPLGGAAPIDPRSDGVAALASAWVEATDRLKETTPLVAIDESAAHYDILFIPGGHGAVFDLPGNLQLQQIIRNMAAQDKIIAALCHGPAAFVEIYQENGHPLVWERTMTAFTNDEEREVGLVHKVPFLLQSRLEELGANFIARPNWEEHTEVDRHLVTGQNPQSSARTAQEVLRVLQDVRLSKGVRTEEQQAEDRERKLLLGGPPGMAA